MNDISEAGIQAVARNLPYPPTPRLYLQPRSPQRPLLRYAATIVLLLIVATLAIPDMRAGLLDFLRIGAVTIYLDGSSGQGGALRLQDVSGEMSLEQARSAVSFPLRIPPDNPPDRVFVQDENLVIMVWLRDQDIEYALYQMADYNWEGLKQTEGVSFTEVSGEFAFWINLEHEVKFLKNGEEQVELTHFVNGSVLIWPEGGVTLRLETDMSLEDATHFAESLEVMP